MPPSRSLVSLSSRFKFCSHDFCYCLFYTLVMLQAPVSSYSELFKVFWNFVCCHHFFGRPVMRNFAANFQCCNHSLKRNLPWKKMLTRSSSYDYSIEILYPCIAAYVWVLFNLQFCKKYPDIVVEGWSIPPLRLRPRCKYLFFSY